MTYCLLHDIYPDPEHCKTCLKEYKEIVKKWIYDRNSMNKANNCKSEEDINVLVKAKLLPKAFSQKYHKP